MADPPAPLLSPRDAAKLAGCGKSTVFRAINAGRLTAWRDPATGRVWLATTDVLAWRCAASELIPYTAALPQKDDTHG